MISPYVRRLRLASELRALRTGAGLTTAQAAKLIGQSRAQVSRMENGHLVEQADIIRLLDALKIDDERWTKIITIAREAGERGWWESNKAMGERQALYANLEAGAETIQEYQLTFVPGLLQTPEFARARVEAADLTGPIAYKPDSAVQARLDRQRMLRRPGGPTYEVILDEAAIRRRVAPPHVMKAQLYHLTATVNSTSSISVRVLPLDALVAGYTVPRSAFSIYTFADPDDPVVVAVDTVTNDLLITSMTEADGVRRYRELYGRLHDAALPVDQSLEFLIKAAETLPDDKG